MADEQDSEKTEQATDARREEFRRKGQVAHTRELAGAILFFCSAGAIWMVSGFYFEQIAEVFSRTMGLEMVQTVRSGQPLDLLRYAATKAVFLIMPVIAAVGVLGALSHILQTGFLQVEDALSPDFNRMNPVEGFKKIFSLRGLAEGLKSIFKLILVGVVVWFLLKSEVLRIPTLSASSPSEIMMYIGTITVKLLFGVGFVMGVLAGADYLFQRWDMERKMMMTKQEVKEEMKQREGDPQIKARIRRVQREMANRRMMEAVPKADVVITNPTHIAVVLKYDDNLPAPQLVAKGADLIAEKIKDLARQHDIPIVENKPLARTIFKTMKIGHVIPRELFVAVAEVLSYVYKLKRKKVKV